MKITAAEILGTAFGILIGAIIYSVIGAWMLMILIGNLHASLIPALPAIGYFDTLSIAVPLASVAAYIRGVEEE